MPGLSNCSPLAPQRGFHWGGAAEARKRAQILCRSWREGEGCSVKRLEGKGWKWGQRESLTFLDNGIMFWEARILAGGGEEDIWNS